MSLRWTLPLLLALTSSVIAIACGGRPPTGRIVDAQLARGADQERRPVDPTTTFSSIANVVHCLVALEDAPEGTLVRAEWRAVDVPDTDPLEVIASVVAETDGLGAIDFTFTPSVSMAPGDYRVDLFVDPRSSKGPGPDRSLAFTVVSEGPRIAGAMINASKAGMEEVVSLPSGSPAIYCHVVVGEPTPGTRVTAVWMAEKTGGAVTDDFEIVRSSLELEGDQNVITFSMEPTEPLPPGTYRVDLFVDDDEDPAHSVRIPITG
jgi:hypothetical protein